MHPGTMGASWRSGSHVGCLHLATARRPPFVNVKTRLEGILNPLGMDAGSMLRIFNDFPPTADVLRFLAMFGLVIFAIAASLAFVRERRRTGRKARA